MTYRYTTQTRTLPGDIHTPVSTYLKLRDLFPQSALMESSDYHGGENGRSFIGLCPIASISIGHDIVVTRMPDGSRQENTLEAEGGMASALNHFLAHFQVTGEGSRYCGLYGYTSFNAVRYLEGIAVKDSRQALNDAPDALYILYRYLIVFNDFNHELMFVEMLGEGETSGLDQVQTAVMNRNFPTYGFHPTGEVTSTLTDDEHRANIRRVPTSAGPLLTACGATCSRWSCRAVSSNGSKATTSTSTVPCAASTPRPTSSTSTSEASASSVPHPKRTAVSPTDGPTSTP